MQFCNISFWAGLKLKFFFSGWIGFWLKQFFFDSAWFVRENLLFNPKNWIILKTRFCWKRWPFLKLTVIVGKLKRIRARELTPNHFPHSSSLSAHCGYNGIFATPQKKKFNDIFFPNLFVFLAFSCINPLLCCSVKMFTISKFLKCVYC